VTLAAVKPVPAAPLRLNLGAGGAPLEGYDNSYDLKQGRSCYPLDLPDDSVEEIRASHVFEHFSHREAHQVLAEWVRVLKPGGLIKLAVPDFEYIARGYLERRAEPWVGYVCGGHSDANDVHLAQYDHASLAHLMREAGLVGIHKWPGAQDCSSLPVSLNLAGWKRPAAWAKTHAVMSVPRLGFMDNFFSGVDVVSRLRLPLRKTTGAFWGQCLTRSIEEALAEGAEWILTIDYDSIYSADTVEALMATAAAHPEVSALVPLQMGRRSNHPLLTIAGENGRNRGEIDRAVLDETLVPINTGHFGLTLLRASAFADLPRPWFIGKPDEDGRWGAGRTDDDIHFWRNWRAAGLQIHCAPRVVIGHAELQVIWPSANLEPLYQYASDYWTEGEPPGTWL
jgi:SAM-dependent methyltransferase